MAFNWSNQLNKYYKDYTNKQNLVTNYKRQTNPYEKQQNDLLNQIKNYKNFVYDLSKDSLYDQYRQQYTALGNQAMTDTLGKASALTGGYANSYAATAGNQAYQGYLSQLNNIVPELYNQAYNRYSNDKNDLYNQYNLVSDQYNTFNNAQDRKYNDLVNAANSAKSLYDLKYANEYQAYQDRLAEQQAAAAAAARSYSSGGSSSKSSSTTATSTSNNKQTAADATYDASKAKAAAAKGQKALFSYLDGLNISAEDKSNYMAMWFPTLAKVLQTPAIKKVIKGIGNKNYLYRPNYYVK